MYLLVLNLITDLPEGTPGGAGGPDEEQVQRWVDLARQGDSLAARRLYRMYVGRLFRVVRPLSSSDADAEDAVQDAFVAALGHLDRYQRRPGTRFVAWLVTIALNTARKQARRTQRWRPLSPERVASLQEGDGVDGAGAGDGLADALDRRRLGEALLRALSGLPERERRIVVLRYGGELNATEVGALVGEQPATVRKICQRQRERLLERLTREPGAPPASRPAQGAP